jgi:tryptophanyl-tRNA synthetase
VQELKEHYRRGGLGDMTIKRHLMQELEELKAPIRESRHELKHQKRMEVDLQHDGTLRAKNEGARKLDEIKEAMKISYRLQNLTPFF